jgi:hypothetical protein
MTFVIWLLKKLLLWLLDVWYVLPCMVGGIIVMSLDNSLPLIGKVLIGIFLGILAAMISYMISLPLLDYYEDYKRELQWDENIPKKESDINAK